MGRGGDRQLLCVVETIFGSLCVMAWVSFGVCARPNDRCRNHYTFL